MPISWNPATRDLGGSGSGSPKENRGGGILEKGTGFQSGKNSLLSRDKIENTYRLVDQGHPPSRGWRQPELGRTLKPKAGNNS